MTAPAMAPPEMPLLADRLPTLVGAEAWFAGRAVPLDPADVVIDVMGVEAVSGEGVVESVCESVLGIDGEGETVGGMAGVESTDVVEVVVSVSESVVESLGSGKV
jgi:hypothetical protein